MRIAVNTRFLIKDQLEGIGWYTYELCKRLVEQHPEHVFIFLFDRPYDPSFVFGTNVIPVIVPPPARHPLLWRLWFDVQLPRVLKRHKADVFFSPDGFMSLPAKVPTCLVVHDIAFEQYPQFYKAPVARFYKKFTPRYCRKAAQVLTVSNFSKQTLVDCYRLPAAKIQIVYNGVSEWFRPLHWEQREAVKKQWTEGREYFICVGAIHPRKNIQHLLKAFSIFKRRFRSNMKLVLVGRSAWMSGEILTSLKTFRFRNEVVVTGYVDSATLAQLVGAAYALVYPSLYEGFGVPIIESLQCEVPVITSLATGMPEAGGDAALYADPKQVEDLADKMGLLYKDEQLRSRLIAHGRVQAARFSWDQAALQAWQAIISLAPSG